MTQCTFITTKKTQCKRNAIINNFCTQHSKITESKSIEIKEIKEIKEITIPVIPKIDFSHFTDINYIENNYDFSNVQPYTNIIQKYENRLKGKIILGLCCIVQTIRTCKTLNGKKLEIFSGRTINSRLHYTPEKAIQKAIQNILDLGKLINYCVLNNIKCFRIGSDIFPRFDDPEVQSYTMDFAKPLLKLVGDFIKLHNIRVLFHPNQLVNIGTPDAKVLDSSIKILQYHAQMLEYMELDTNAVLIIHGGGVYDDKNKTIQRWITQFNTLPDNIKSRLVIENCEKCYHVRNCLDISKQTCIPVVFDTHHYECYNILHPNEFTETPEQFLDEVIDTWKNRTVLMHVSNQREDSVIGAHSDYINTIPEYLFELICKREITIHLEQEAKMKNLSIFQTRKLYGNLVQ